MGKVSVSIVSFLNTQPFIYGLKNSSVWDKIDLSSDVPSDCAHKLVHNEVDLGLVPVAIIPELSEHYIVSDYCIGADGPVKSVFLFSQCPINELRTIYLDSQSRTSNMLMKLLADKLWMVDLKYQKGAGEYHKDINGAVGGVVIGDRAIKLRGKFNYQYDLVKKVTDSISESTHLILLMHKLIWLDGNPELSTYSDISNGGLGDKFFASKQTLDFDVVDYLRNGISYDFDERKKQALKTFLNHLKEDNYVSELFENSLLNN